MDDKESRQPQHVQAPTNSCTTSGTPSPDKSISISSKPDMEFANSDMKCAPPAEIVVRSRTPSESDYVPTTLPVFRPVQSSLRSIKKLKQAAGQLRTVNDWVLGDTIGLSVRSKTKLGLKSALGEKAALKIVRMADDDERAKRQWTR